MIKSYAQTEVACKDEAVLFAFDDFSIPATRNLGLQMVRPDKYADNPVVARGLPGEPDSHRAQMFGTVLYIDGKFRMWYNATPSVDVEINYDIRTGEQLDVFIKKIKEVKFFIAYAESTDGIHWEKPVLGLVEFNGTTQNNIIMDVDTGDGGYGNPCVLYDPEENDPNKRYKMAFERNYSFTGWNNKRERITGFFTSPDGIIWQEITNDKLICQQFEVVTIYKFNGLYHLGGHQVSPTVTLPPGGQSCGRVMVTFSSQQFDAWPEERTISFYKPELSSAPNSVFDGEEVHLGSSVWSRGNVCIGLYGQWHHAPEDRKPVQRPDKISIDLGLVVSNDGLHFREPDPAFTLIQRDQEAFWDRDAPADAGKTLFLFQANAFVNVEDKTYIWYSATTDGGNVLEVHSNIGLSTIRRDGFGYLQLNADAEDGSLLSCCLETDEEKGLYLNIDGVAGAPIELEIMGSDGVAPLPGFAKENLRPVAQDGVRVRVERRDGQAVTLPLDRKFRIRVLMNRTAKLFAMYIG